MAVSSECWPAAASSRTHTGNINVGDLLSIRSGIWEDGSLTGASGGLFFILSEVRHWYLLYSGLPGSGPSASGPSTMKDTGRERTNRKKVSTSTGKTFLSTSYGRDTLP